MFVLVKLSLAENDISEAQVAEDLQLSQSQVHRAIMIGVAGGLVLVMAPRGRGRMPFSKRINRRALYELLAFGVPYFFPVAPGRITRGIATGASAPVLRGVFMSDPEPLVWPHPEGDLRGMAVAPLHPSAPNAARRDPPLYDLLALIDAVRVGRARERDEARKLLGERLL